MRVERIKIWEMVLGLAARIMSEVVGRQSLAVRMRACRTRLVRAKKMSQSINQKMETSSRILPRIAATLHHQQCFVSTGHPNTIRHLHTRLVPLSESRPLSTTSLLVTEKCTHNQEIEGGTKFLRTDAPDEAPTQLSSCARITAARRQDIQLLDQATTAEREEGISALWLGRVQKSRTRLSRTVDR